MKFVLTLRILIPFLILITGCESPNYTLNENIHRYPPSSISLIPDQTVFMNNKLGPISFSIDAWDFPNENLLISVVSSNKEIVDSSDIVLGVSGRHRTITITPKIGQTGETKITIIARDRRRVESTSFKLTVLKRRENLKYPTVIFPLPESELQKLKAEFDSLNDTRIKSELNMYGFIHIRGLLDRGKSAITDTCIAVAKAKSAVWKFRKFTNVIDTKFLFVEGANRSPDARFTDWIIHLKQWNNGLIIEDVEMVVLIHQEVVQMYGHTYKNVFIPIHDLIEKERAIKSLLGYEIEYDCKIRNKFLISIENVFMDDINMVIYPKKTDNIIELRVAWKIPIGSVPHPRWNIYIDVLTGEIIYIKELFIC